MTEELPPEGSDLPAVVRDRHEKLRRLTESGEEAYARSYPRTHTTTEALALLGEGQESEQRVRLAGRLMGRRDMGGVAFYPLQDGAGRLQLWAKRDVLGDAAYQRLAEVDVGDWIGAEGRLARTRRGERSLVVESFQLLSKSLRPLPEKFHGLRDVETRYRQRYVDLLVNPETRAIFEARSRVIAGIRSLLDARGFLEVETPVLQELPGGGHARPFVTHHNSLDRDLYLRIALELHLKRLLVGGIERVYEIGRVFRNEGLSPRHNPEFTMLECYQALATYEDMMTLVEDIFVVALDAAGSGPEVDYDGELLRLAPPFRRVGMSDLVLEVTGRKRTGLELNDVFEAEVQKGLRDPVFVLDYPVEISPLARRRTDDPRFVERFELIAAGHEIANAFTELTDPVDQRRRLEEQAAALAAGDPEAHPFDEDFVRAIEYGMPPAGGLGIGIDRLMMLVTGRASIRDVILFPQLKEEA